jgi:hypothetical protein
MSLEDRYFEIESWKQGLQHGLIAAYRARFGTIPLKIVIVIDATHDTITLKNWFELVCTGSSEEIADTLRAADQRAWRAQTAPDSGPARGLQRALITIYGARFGGVQPDIAAAIEATHDAFTLKSWFELISMRSPSEISAAVRAGCCRAAS